MTSLDKWTSDKSFDQLRCQKIGYIYIFLHVRASAANLDIMIMYHKGSFLCGVATMSMTCGARDTQGALK